LLLLFLTRSTMTITWNASCEDILLLEDFLDCAWMDFDSVSMGVFVGVVDGVFWKYTGWANED
jgi:hypothetical protein